MRIGILVSNQQPHEDPEHFLSAKLRERALLYRHDGKRAVAEVAKHKLRIVIPSLTFSKLKALLKSPEMVKLASGKTFLPANYVPEKLPPAEISGCKFREPDSPTWREYHRLAVPPSQIGL